jgi:hypothetical protein
MSEVECITCNDIGYYYGKYCVCAAGQEKRKHLLDRGMSLVWVDKKQKMERDTYISMVSLQGVSIKIRSACSTCLELPEAFALLGELTSAITALQKMTETRLREELKRASDPY